MSLFFFRNGDVDVVQFEICLQKDLIRQVIDGFGLKILVDLASIPSSVPVFVDGNA
jgi:hypothetical protein